VKNFRLGILCENSYISKLLVLASAKYLRDFGYLACLNKVQVLLDRAFKGFKGVE
tara:strand:+ start:2708 stop:2872 length:165 start_codon:yes stop_codon:yes gene_type:complete